MQVLAGDVGGTKTLLAIVEVDAAGPAGALSIELRESLRYDSRQYPGLGAICRAFAAQLGRPIPTHAGFGVAGPVSAGRVHTTNLPWVLEERELAQVMGIESVQLANDFHALALGIPAVKPKDLVTLNEGALDPSGPWALIGAGTGLGEAIAVLNERGRREVLPSEGGHASFAPRGDYVAGGIAPKLLAELQDGRLRAAFVSKGRMRRILEAMPVQVVLDPHTTVLGAAALAASQATVPTHVRHIPAIIP